VYFRKAAIDFASDNASSAVSIVAVDNNNSFDSEVEDSSDFDFKMPKSIANLIHSILRGLLLNFSAANFNFCFISFLFLRFSASLVVVFVVVSSFSPSTTVIREDSLDNSVGVEQQVLLLLLIVVTGESEISFRKPEK
jgi:hypothetical protein